MNLFTNTVLVRTLVNEHRKQSFRNSHLNEHNYLGTYVNELGVHELLDKRTFVNCKHCLYLYTNSALFVYKLFFYTVLYICFALFVIANDNKYVPMSDHSYVVLLLGVGYLGTRA